MGQSALILSMDDDIQMVAVDSGPLGDPGWATDQWELTAEVAAVAAAFFTGNPKMLSIELAITFKIMDHVLRYLV